MAGPYRRVRAANNTSIEDRLRLHTIEAPSGCWVWTGTRNRGGHGRIQINGSNAYVHRVAYELYVGPIPEGLEIDHLCRRPACLNPRHLQAVTPSVNVRRGTSPGARAARRDKCSAGHSFAEHGAVRHGRRICRPCRREYCAQWRTDVAAGRRVPVRRTKDAAA